MFALANQADLGVELRIREFTRDAKMPIGIGKPCCSRDGALVYEGRQGIVVRYYCRYCRTRHTRAFHVPMHVTLPK